MDSPPIESPIEEYLSAVATVQTFEQYVAPKEDVSRRIELEIQRTSGCSPALLAVEQAAGKVKQIDPIYIPAHRKTFSSSMLKEISRLSATLTEHGAKEFQITIRNESTTDNLWRDRILVAARYTT